MPKLPEAANRNSYFDMKQRKKFYYIFNKFIDKLDFIVPLESFIFSISVRRAVDGRSAARWPAVSADHGEENDDYKRPKMIIFETEL